MPGMPGRDSFARTIISWPIWLGAIAPRHPLAEVPERESGGRAVNVADVAPVAACRSPTPIAAMGSASSGSFA